MTNLTVDLKEAQINLGKMETVKMNLWQSFDSLKQIIRILREKKLLGKFEDWRDLMCEDCKYKKKLMEDVIKLELEGTIKGEDKKKEIYFSYDDWELFLDKVKEKSGEKKVEVLRQDSAVPGKTARSGSTPQTDSKLDDLNVPEEYKPIPNISMRRKDAKYKKRRIRCKECNELYSKEELKNHECMISSGVII